MAPRNPEPPPPAPLRPAPERFLSTGAISKRSFLSHSSSFEADDERSTSPSRSARSADSSMESSIDPDRDGDPGARNGNAVGVRPPSYPGEDTRPTSSKELAGWYMYAFASETYMICAIASFIPILLESLARENGVLESDRTTPCRSSNDKQGGDGQCVVYVLGIEINTASFAMYTFSISVLLQALLVVSISAAADHGNYRKKLLLSFAWIGSFSVMLYIFITKETYVLGAILTIISNTSFGASFVLLNSFLPLLVRNHPQAEAAVGTPDLNPSDGENQPLEDSTTFVVGDDADAEAGPDDSTAALLSSGRSPNGRRLSRVMSKEDVTNLEMSLSTQISAKGIGVGYGAGLLVQCVSILVVLRMKSSDATWSQRVVLFGIGAWWTLFTIPAAMWLRPRPGPPLPSTSNSTGLRALASYLGGAWKSLFRTAKQARHLVDIVLFLAAWFLLSDAVATTSSTAILFAKTTLHMEVWQLGLISVITTITGIAGAFLWVQISRRFSLKPHHTILANIALFELIPLYGLLGYLPFVQSWGVLGLQQAWEMYPLAAVYGIVLGGLGSYCRSLFGEIIPPGSEAAFYALYAITDKGSSVFGPAIVGAIIDASGEIRPAFWFLAVLVGLPSCFIYFVDVERGKREGKRLSERLRRQAGIGTGDEEESEEGHRGILEAYDEDEGEETEQGDSRRR